ncbi:hypothetical protein BGP_6286 [Beggiatoa sp. PS]|nr:hypothetical protein BGP_6286 [Beggiatoa sp. PS]
MVSIAFIGDTGSNDGLFRTMMRRFQLPSLAIPVQTT